MQKANLNIEHYSANCNHNGFLGISMQAYTQTGDKLHKDIKVISDEENGIHKNYYANLQNLKLLQLKCFNVNQTNMLHNGTHNNNPG